MRRLHFTDGATALRVPYGHEPAYVVDGPRCPDCSTPVGSTHADGCRREQCPRSIHPYPEPLAHCTCTALPPGVRPLATRDQDAQLQPA